MTLHGTARSANYLSVILVMKTLTASSSTIVDIWKITTNLHMYNASRWLCMHYTQQHILANCNKLCKDNYDCVLTAQSMMIAYTVVNIFYEGDRW